MANINWPTDLPRTLNIDGLEVSEEDPVIRTSMDMGPEKVRLRYSRPPKNVSGTMYLNESQRQLLEYFYTITIKRVLRFNFHNPQTDELREYRFREPPKQKGSSSGIYEISLSLEEL